MKSFNTEIHHNLAVRSPHKAHDDDVNWCFRSQSHFFLKTTIIKINHLNNVQFCFNDEVWRLESWKSGSCFGWQNWFVAEAEMKTNWEFVWLDQVFTVAQWLLSAAGKQGKSVSVLRKRGVWIPFESEHEKTGSEDVKWTGMNVLFTNTEIWK